MSNRVDTPQNKTTDSHNRLVEATEKKGLSGTQAALEEKRRAFLPPEAKKNRTLGLGSTETARQAKQHAFAPAELVNTNAQLGASQDALVQSSKGKQPRGLAATQAALDEKRRAFSPPEAKKKIRAPGLGSTQNALQTKQQVFAASAPAQEGGNVASLTAPSTIRGLRKANIARQAKAVDEPHDFESEEEILASPRAIVAPLQQPSASSKQDLVAAMPVRESQANVLGEAEPIDLEEIERKKSQEKKKQMQRVSGCLFLLCLVLTAVVLAIVFTVGRSKTTTTTTTKSLPSSSPSLVPSFSPSSAPTDLLVDVSEYARLAKNPALGSFYFALGGDYAWAKEFGNWLDYNTKECFWYSDLDNTIASGSAGAGYPEGYEVEDGLCHSASSSGYHPRNPNATNCNEDGRIKELTFRWTVPPSFRGQLPPEFFFLTSLTKLDTRYNSISGSIPSTIGLLTNRTELFVQHNELTGEFPTQVGLLTQLGDLQAQSNSFTSLPSELGRLQNLETLLLQDNELRGSLPSEIGNLKNTYMLNLANNFLSGSVPALVGDGVLFYSQVSLQGNQLTAVPSEVGLVYKRFVWMLDLSHNHIASLPTELFNLATLVSLRLHSNNLSSLPSEVGRMPQLGSCYLDFTFFDNPMSRIPSQLGLLTGVDSWWSLGEGLRTLDLSAMPLLTGSVPEEIFQLEDLRHVNLSGSPGLSGTIPENICYLQNASCSYCSLDFDCSANLCGCDCYCSIG